MHVYAAGNSGNRSCDPDTSGFGTILAYYPVSKNVLTVGNVNLDRQLAYNSSKGPTADGRIKPEIAARGVLVNSAAHEAGYRLSSGTSMAAPFVTGVIALMLQQEPGLYPEEIHQRLRATAQRDEDTSAVWNPEFGYGKIDVEALLNYS